MEEKDGTVGVVASATFVGDVLLSVFVVSFGGTFVESFGIALLFSTGGSVRLTECIC